MSLHTFFKSTTSNSTRRRLIHRFPSTSRLALEVLEDRRTPSFSPSAAYPVGLDPQSVVASDLNNDGHTDLVTANRGESTVGVLLGNGDGTFQAARTSATGRGPRSVLTGDLNGDGRIDLVTVNIWDASSGDLSVLLGNGDGLFQAPRSIALPAQIPPGYAGSPLAQAPRSAALSDLNADGRLDLIAGGCTQFDVEIGYDPDTQSPIIQTRIDGYVNVRLGNGDGTFGYGATYPVAANSLAIGDFDGDDRLDVLAAADRLTTLLGNGDGTLQTPRNSTDDGYNAFGNPSIPMADFNRDGMPDLLMRDTAANVMVVMLGNGDGIFRPTQAVYTDGLHVTVFGDVNADGNPDIVGLNTTFVDTYGYGGLWASSARVLLGRGDGTFAAPIFSDLGISTETYFTSVVLADFDGNGFPDIAGSAWGYEFYGDYLVQREFIAVSRNNGDWTVPPPPLPSITMSDVTVSEGNTGTRAASFIVTLSAAYGQPVTVTYTTGDGTAAAGSDYQAASGTLTIPAGQTTGTITVLVNGDRRAEENETFSVNLSSPSNATITDGQGIGTIVDDEPRISIGDVTMHEGKRGKTTLFTFTITLSAAYDQAVTMTFATVNGTATTSDGDYIAKTGTLTFAPGETTKMITIVVKGDSKRESNEFFYLDLFGNTGNSLFTQNRGTGTILNDDR